MVEAVAVMARELLGSRRIATAQREHDAGRNQREADPEIEGDGLCEQQPAEERPDNRLEEHEEPRKRSIHVEEALVPEAEASRRRDEAEVEHRAPDGRRGHRRVVRRGQQPVEAVRRQGQEGDEHAVERHRDDGVLREELQEDRHEGPSDGCHEE